jgi:NAD(P)-dependent dehydrogenase (short-subunit alcohol dehydrogenase family)
VPIGFSAWDRAAEALQNALKGHKMTNKRKTAIFTGAWQGIGAGLVEAFLRRDYSVAANSRKITKTNPFPASDDLALIDGDIGDPKIAAEIAKGCPANASFFGGANI